MDMLSKDTDITPNAYRYLINARQRYGNLQSIQKSLNITYNLPAGNLQGIYAVGQIWIAFISGQGFYMPVGGTVWFQIPFLQMDAFVSYIYVAAVPGSTNNFFRQATSTSVTSSTGIKQDKINANGPIIQTPFFVSGTPAGLVVQDGINQPWIVTYDSINNNATARILGTYDQWDNSGQSTNNQEYVPIGTLMMYLAPVLYIVSPDGNTIYRSVSGAPLNFMINIDTNGNKLATESLGGAQTTSFAIDFDKITYLAPSTTEANTFIIGTNRNIYGMQPDFTTTIFGEPTFDKAFQLLSGIVNQFSAADNNGDTVFIDLKAVKSFNAVQTVKFAGRNDPFSKNISSAIDGILQRTVACFSFNNYIYFALQTIFGDCVAIYDNINKVWVGFDVTTPSSEGIKMFAQADFLDTSYLAAGTKEGNIYIVEGDTENSESGILQMRAIITGDYEYGTFYPGSLTDEHKLNNVKMLITNGISTGWATVQEIVDDQRGQIKQQNINGKMSGMPFEMRFPISFNNNFLTQNLNFSMDNGRTGYKISPIIIWNTDCKIEQIELLTNSISRNQSQKQQQLMFKGGLSPNPIK